MKATIFSIQRTSFVDGPGVRTTVFFKGCNLRCLWCHNPESQQRKPQLLYYTARCTGCGTCMAACNAIKADFSVNREKCIACGKCESLCLNNARELSGREMTPEEIMQEVLPDRPYYQATGGGVTFSGGECMLYPQFLRELLRLCRDESIDAAVDTAGHVPFSSFEEILPYNPLFLYDLKAFDPQIHRKLTGVDNRLILDNYLRLHSSYPHRIFVRIPVIPSWNDGELPALAAFLKEHPPAKVELLGYHKLGISKMQALGEAVFEAQEPTAQQMANWTALFEGLSVASK